MMPPKTQEMTGGSRKINGCPRILRQPFLTESVWISMDKTNGLQEVSDE